MKLTQEEKIQYIINNEGCEGADGFNGLQTFLRYCVSENERKDFEKSLEPIIDGWYESTKEYVDEEESYSFKTFDELPTICIIYRYKSDSERFTKINDSLFDFEGNKVNYTNEELFLIDFYMSRYGAV